MNMNSFVPERDIEECYKRHKMWVEDPERATCEFKQKIREKKDPSIYLSVWVIDMLDDEDIEYVKEWQNTHKTAE